MKIAFHIYAGFENFDKPAIRITSLNMWGIYPQTQVHLAMYLVTGQYHRYLLYSTLLTLMTRETQRDKCLQKKT